MINLKTDSVPPLTWVMTWPKRTHFVHLPPGWVWATIPTTGPPTVLFIYFDPPRRKRRISNDTEDRQSWEGYFGTELNLYNVGDVDLYFQIMAYPGISAPDRWRTDAKLDLKYDLPLDFYIKLGLSFNYDNRPADNASETDYLFQTGIGWEW